MMVFTRQPPLSPTSEIVMGGATRAGRNQGHAVVGEVSDAVDAHGLDGFDEGHHWQDGGESACLHRCPRARGTQEDVMVRTTASPLRSLEAL